MRTRGIGLAVLVVGLLLLLLLLRTERAGVRAPPSSSAPAVPVPAAPGPVLQGAAPVSVAEAVAPAPAPVEPAAPLPATVDQAIQVIDAEDREGLEAASVSLSWSGVVVQALGAGRFALRGEMPPMDLPLHVQVSAPHHLPRQLDLEPGDHLPPTLALQRAGRVHGRVLLENGTPVEGAAVRIDTVRTETDEEGQFSLAPLPLRKDMRPYAQHAMGRTGAVEPVRLEAWRRELEITLTLEGGCAHVVEVRDADGTPVADAEAYIEFADRRMPPIQVKARTDANGEARLQGLRPGTFLVIARAEGFDHASREGVVIDASGSVGRTVLVLPPGGRHWLGGRVVDPDGNPIAGVAVDVGNRMQTHAWTDRDGRFRIEGLTTSVKHTGMGQAGPAYVNLYLEKKGWVAAGAYPMPYDEEAELLMAQPASVRGRLLDPDGRPLPEAGAHFYPDDAMPTSLREHVLAWPPSIAAGPFQALAPGCFHLEQIMAVPGTVALGSGTLEYLGKHVPVHPKPGEDLDLGDIRLDPPIVVRGRILGVELPRPQQWMVVGIRLIDDNERRVAGTAHVADGTYETRHVRAGTYTMIHLRRGYVSSAVPVTVDWGDEVEVDLRVWRSAVLEIRAPGSTHATLHYSGPHETAWAWQGMREVRRGRARYLERDEGYDARALDDDGTTSFEELLPGQYEVVLRRDAVEVTRVEVEVAEGERVSVSPKE